MMAVTAIHQRRAKAVAKVGAMAVLRRREDYERTGEHKRTEMVFLWRRRETEKKNGRQNESQIKMSATKIMNMHFMGLYEVL